jgi:amino acid efflux transporter
MKRARDRASRRRGSGLNRWQAIPLAIGSIAGSGILFLPSTVYAETGRNSLLVWLAATAACLPMLVMFQDMVRANPAGDGIEAFIRAGLGDLVGRCVPLMFISVVIIGLPLGAVVAGRYVAHALGAGTPVIVAAAVTVLGAAVAANLAGARTNTWVQHAGAAALFTMAVVLLTAAAARGGSGVSAVTPDWHHLGVLLPGVLLAFWTFIGFENLTFLSREFRRPESDFLPVTATALGIYGLLTALLTMAIAVRVPRRSVDSVTGLFQLAHTMQPRQLLGTAVAIVAFGAATINTTAWVWGVSRLTANAARLAIIPSAFAHTTPAGVPRRAVLLLAACFAVTLTVLILIPGILIDALAAASAIFIMLYLLSIVSYLRVRRPSLRSLANVPLLLLFGASLIESGWRSAYGLIVLLAALTAQIQHRRRRRRADATRSKAGADEPHRRAAAARVVRSRPG